MVFKRWVIAFAALLALTVLGAHFWRSQEWWGVVACGALGALAFMLDRPWALRALQLALAVGSLEWLMTAMLLAQQREALGMPWGRMAVILGGVALFTAFTAWLLGRRR